MALLLMHFQIKQLLSIGFVGYESSMLGFVNIFNNFANI